MGQSKKTEEQVNEDLWISLEGIISPVNRIARANDKDEIRSPAPVSRITEQVVRDIKSEVTKLGKSIDSAQARELRQFTKDLDDLADEVKQFNSNTRVYM